MNLKVNQAKPVLAGTPLKLKSQVQKGRKSYFGDCYCWCHDGITWL